MYFDPTWIFDEKPPKTDYPNVTGLMGNMPKKQKTQQAPVINSLADVFSPDVIRPPLAPQNTYQDVAGHNLVSNITPTPPQYKKDPTKPNIHVLAESPKRLWHQQSDFQHTFTDYRDYLAKKKFGKSFDDLIRSPELSFNDLYGTSDDPFKMLGFEDVNNYNEYRKSIGMPPVEQEFVSNYFMDSANRLRNNLPNVNITQLYKDEAVLDSILKTVKPNDKIVLIGHNGNRLFGINNKNIANKMNELIPDKSGVECLLGACNSQNMMYDFKDSGMKVNASDHNAWYVPHDKGSDLYEMMYGWDYDWVGAGYNPAKAYKAIKRVPSAQKFKTLDFGQQR